MANFYIISTNRDGSSAPFFFDTMWVPDLPEFSLPEGLIPIVRFQSFYEVTADIQELDVDILIDDFLASDSFVDVCKSVGAPYLSIPLVVYLNDGARTAKSFNFFCVVERRSILDQENSKYELADSRLLNAAAINRPVYERINTFVVRADARGELFFCEDINKVVCSARFKSEFQRNHLGGCVFTPIDDEYQFAPWDNFI